MKIFLVGMMGCGKSYWSRQLGRKLKTGGYDLDMLIETFEEKTISEIFSEQGEVYFREAEAKVLRWFKEKKAYVLATGGGAPCFKDNMQWMNKEGITIWLDEPVETLVERLLPRQAQRPLLQGLSPEEIHQFLLKKLEERTPFYNQAKYRLTGNITDQSFKAILDQHA